MTSQIKFVAMGDLHSKPKEIRVWLMGGEEMLLTHSGKLLAYIQPLKERDLDDLKKMMTLEYLRNHRDEFLYSIMTGEDVVLSFHKRKLALITPNIPNKYVKEYEKHRQEVLEERRKKRKKSSKK